LRTPVRVVIMERRGMTLRMCTSVAGYMTLILTSGLSSEWLSQPSIHAYWKKKGRQRRMGGIAIERRELTMSVVPISLVVDMRPSENEGSAVLSIRIMAGFASVASEISEAVDLSVPSKVTLRATGSSCRCRECSSIRQSTREVVLTLVQNSPEHKPVEFKVHICEK